MAAKSYCTPGAEAEAELTEKKSRFIAAVKPVNSEAEAVAFIKERRELYPDARHHVYAYLAETEDGLFSRYSDDGEPQGTGGLPVFEVIRKRGLTNCAVVVTRYFGGTLLGAAGLVRAYSGSAAMCLDIAGTDEVMYCRRLDVRTDYSDSGRVRNLLGDYRGDILAEQPVYGQDVLFPVWAGEAEVDAICEKITDATASRARIVPGPWQYIRFRKENN